MYNYEELLHIAENSHVKVVEKQFRSSSKGLCKGSIIAIRKDMTIHEKTCILAEELGHHYKTVGNIIDQTDTNNRKQEKKARNWGFDRLFNLNDILTAHLNGCRNAEEVADFLGITTEYLNEALLSYRARYGIVHIVGEYKIIINDVGYYIIRIDG